jgi:ligand-binding SRPBCC domain-containing protein
MTLVVWTSHFDVAAERLFAFHQDARNLPRITPPPLSFELLIPPAASQEGDVQLFRMGLGPFKSNWRARITRVVVPRLIEDTQEAGLFRSWRHQHRVAPEPGGSRLTDVVSFRLLPTPAGEFIDYFAVRPALLAMFAYRHWRTRALLSSA